MLEIQNKNMLHEPNEFIMEDKISEESEDELMYDNDEIDIS